MDEENIIPDGAEQFTRGGPNKFLEAMQPAPVLDDGSDEVATGVESGETVPFAELNEAFANYESVLDHIDDLRKIEDPILVDLDGTVWTSDPEDREIRPGMAEVLTGIREQGGTVVYLTSSRERNSDDHDIKLRQLQIAGLWTEDSLLITSDSWGELCTDPLPSDRQAIKDAMMTEFEELCLEQGWIDPNAGRRDPRSPSNLRRVRRQGDNDKNFAPVFLKRHEIPLIDDNANIRDRLGMHPLRIESFYASSKREEEVGYSFAGSISQGQRGSISLEEVEQELAQHFAR